MRTILIELENISKRYPLGSGGVNALSGVSLSVDAGEFVAVVGASGSGKSTLMNILGCLDRPSEGRYLLGGRDVGRMSSRELAALRGSEIGFVFQNFNLLPRLTALENVEMPLILRGEPRTSRRDKARRALCAVGLEHRLDHRPQELSGGQQQRVAIARALVTRPKLILADEPTGNLDRTAGAGVLDALEHLGAGGATVVLITHDPETAARAHKRVTLRDGRVL